MCLLDRRAILAALSSAALPLPSMGADFWVSKPPSEWTDKDLQKLITDSPWACLVSVTDPRSSGGSMPSGGRGGRRGGGGGGGTGIDASDSSGMGGGDMGGGRGGGMGGSMQGAPPSIPVHVRWLSAKPIKIATIRARMGAEANTSPQAKEFVERRESDYVIAVIIPHMAPRREDSEHKGPDPSLVERLKQSTTLTCKGRDVLRPGEVIPPSQSNIAYVFRFSKTPPITLEDKEVEFETRLGPWHIKHKFKLKEMVFDGMLEL